jgi:hypothetical protein
LWQLKPFISRTRALRSSFSTMSRAILQSLETELGVKATAREGWIKLEGEADGVECAKQLFPRWKTC